MKRKTFISKAFISFLTSFIFFIFMLTSCVKGDHFSAKPAIFTIVKVEQDIIDKNQNVAMYKIREYTFSSTGGDRLLTKDYWFCLQEGFEVGDTIQFVKNNR